MCAIVNQPTCSFCKKIVGDNVRFCDECGTGIYGAPVPLYKRQFPPQPTCWHCGYPRQRSDSYCNYCGGELRFKPDPGIEPFARIADQYCRWAESISGEPREEMLMARKFLLELYRAAIDLPDLGPGKAAEDGVSAEECESVSRRFHQLPVIGYWDILDPLKETAPVFNTVNDVLSDIYPDLKKGLVLYFQGDLVEAVWQWRFNFEIHWGAHLTGAQRAIHVYFSKKA